MGLKLFSGDACCFKKKSKIHSKKPAMAYFNKCVGLDRRLYRERTLPVNLGNFFKRFFIEKAGLYVRLYSSYVHIVRYLVHANLRKKLRHWNEFVYKNS